MRATSALSGHLHERERQEVLISVTRGWVPTSKRLLSLVPLSGSCRLLLPKPVQQPDICCQPSLPAQQTSCWPLLEPLQSLFLAADTQGAVQTWLHTEPWLHKCWKYADGMPISPFSSNFKILRPCRLHSGGPSSRADGLGRSRESYPRSHLRSGPSRTATRSGSAFKASSWSCGLGCLVLPLALRS